MAAILLAGQMGYREIVVTQTEITSTMQRVPTKILGIPIDETWVPVTTTRVITKSLLLK